MTRIAGAIILMLVWAVVTGSFTLHNLFLGLVLGALALVVIREEKPPGGYTLRPWPTVILIGLFLKELAMSAISMAALVIRRDMDLKPGIFAYPLKLKSDFEITLLANLITLTPGTLSVDVAADRNTLYVHAIDCSDPNGARAAIASGFERRIMEAFGR